MYFRALLLHLDNLKPKSSWATKCKLHLETFSEVKRLRFVEISSAPCLSVNPGRKPLEFTALHNINELFYPDFDNLTDIRALKKIALIVCTDSRTQRGFYSRLIEFWLINEKCFVDWMPFFHKLSVVTCRMCHCEWSNVLYRKSFSPFPGRFMKNSFLQKRLTW